jgi:hypothetical protein
VGCDRSVGRLTTALPLFFGNYSAPLPMSSQADKGKKLW